PFVWPFWLCGGRLRGGSWGGFRRWRGSLRRDERRLRRFAAMLEHHRRPLRLEAPRDPDQPVVKIGQTVEGDRSAVKDPEPDAHNARIAGRQGDGVQHEQPAEGEDFAKFVDALHPQSLDVAVPVRRVDRIKSRHHRGIEGVDPSYASVGIGRELREPAAERMADGDDLSLALPVALVALDMA